MRTSHIVVGLAYGDEGKGSWVDHLVRRHEGIRYTIRFNGGAQAAHHVCTPEGIKHSFAQFASSMFVPGTYSCLSRFMLIEPEALLKEAKKLCEKGVDSPLSRTIVSENAPIIPPFNRSLNRIQEVSRGASRHGSCGYGIGLTQGDVETLGGRALFMRDLREPSTVRKKLLALQEIKLEAAAAYRAPETEKLISEIARADIELYVRLFCDFYANVRVYTDADFSQLIRENDSVFEGAQGLLLDQFYGFYPHCSRSNCNFENALTLLREAEFDGRIERIGLLRGYGTRHGAGPFPTLDPTLPIPPCDNATNVWQGEFRVGCFDAVTARYALEVVGGVDTLAITNLDRMSELETVKVATRYETEDRTFFDAKGIVLNRLSYPELSARTSSLFGVRPQYTEFAGFGSSENGRRRYLEQLSAKLEHPIQAFSASAGPEKGYL